MKSVTNVYQKRKTAEIGNQKIANIFSIPTIFFWFLRINYQLYLCQQNYSIGFFFENVSFFLFFNGFFIILPTFLVGRPIFILAKISFSKNLAPQKKNANENFYLGQNFFFSKGLVSKKNANKNWYGQYWRWPRDMGIILELGTDSANQNSYGFTSRLKFRISYYLRIHNILLI